MKTPTGSGRGFLFAEFKRGAQSPPATTKRRVEVAIAGLRSVKK